MRSPPESQERAGQRCLLEAVPGLGQVAMAFTAVTYWSLVSGVRFGWFWAGAALWALAVALKLACARMTNRQVIHFLRKRLPYPMMVTGAGLFTGIQSSFFEMGGTMLGVMIWPALGHEARRAIAVGVGAGAFEALVLGIISLASGLIPASDRRTNQAIPANGMIGASATPLIYLVAPVERIIAILCHAASRALILLGAVHGSATMIFWGYTLFALLDGMAGAAHVSGKVRTLSLWWIELAMSPFALASIPIIVWCYGKYSL